MSFLKFAPRLYERFGLDSKRLRHGNQVRFVRFEEADELGQESRLAGTGTKLVSSADTGFFYVTKKNPRTQTDKLTFRKYDPVARKHVDFKEAKIK